MARPEVEETSPDEVLRLAGELARRLPQETLYLCRVEDTAFARAEVRLSPIGTEILREPVLVSLDKLPGEVWLRPLFGLDGQLFIMGDNRCTWSDEAERHLVEFCQKWRTEEERAFGRHRCERSPLAHVVMSLFRTPGGLPSLRAELAQQLSGIFDAEGIILSYQGAEQGWGFAPEADDLRELLCRLRMEAPDSLISTHRVADEYHLLRHTGVGGFLYVPFNRGRDCFLFFRRAWRADEVRWLHGPPSSVHWLGCSRGWQTRHQVLALNLKGQTLECLQAISQEHKASFVEASRRMYAEVRQLSLVASRTTSGVFIADGNLRVTWVNEALRRMSGLGDDDLVGHGFPWRVDDIQMEHLRGQLADLRPFSAEVRLENEGRERWVFAELTPVAGRLGHLEQVIGILTDVHRLKMAEQEIQQKNRSLESTNEELRQALEDMRTLAAQADAAAEAKTNFLATMSHEIRTPLNGILGMACLLNETLLEGEQREFLNTILTCGHTLRDIINNILDFIKLEAEKVTLEREPFCLQDVVASCLQTVEVAAGRKSLRLECGIDPRIPGYVSGDSVRLQQVLLNLLSNAVKFTDRGSVTIEVAYDERTRDRHAVTFRVRDTGPGIPVDKQHQLFQAFSQLDSSINRLHEGTGLGLAISQRIVRAMGGQLAVQSEVGKGTEFSFRVEFEGCESELAAPKYSDIFPEPTDAPLRVLVVEDNPVNQDVTRLILNRLGHRCTVISGGEQAVEVAEGEAFDAILLDLQMPGIDGFETCRRIREGHGPSAQAWISALTAHTLATFRARARAAGMDAFLSKPVRPQDLVDSLRRSQARDSAGVR